jgi:IS605 OrfB family transposase
VKKISKHIKNVFLYGKPTKVKFDELRKIQKLYSQLINSYIEYLLKEENMYLYIFQNNKKDTNVRKFEKRIRKEKLNCLGSALGQNAFDHAFKELHNHFMRIKNYMYGVFIGKGDIVNFVSSICLLNASILNLDPFAELNKLININKNKILTAKKADAKKKYENNIEYYNDLLNILQKHKNKEISDMMSVIKRTFFEELTARKIPMIKNTPIQLDSRICKVQKADNIKADYVIRVKTLQKGKWMDIPLKASRHGKWRLEQYKNCSPAIGITDKGLLKVSIPVEKEVNSCKYNKTIGVDVGETELMHTSEDMSYGTFTHITLLYNKIVLPKLKNRNKLRSLMQKYRKKLKQAKTEEQKTKLREKIGNINKMLQGRKSLNRVLRKYSHAVESEISCAVKSFVNDIKGENVLVSIEDLNILEFDRGRKSNRRDSNWARGQLINKLKDKLTWIGKKIIEVEPAYTSQECPVCHYTDKGNRKNKQFSCLCCGYKNDADLVGAINIKNRAEDEAIEEIVKEYQYNKKKRHEEIKGILNKRHETYLDSAVAGATI